jgi:hypothetical protein
MAAEYPIPRNVAQDFRNAIGAYRDMLHWGDNKEPRFATIATRAHAVSIFDDEMPNDIYNRLCELWGGPLDDRRFATGAACLLHLLSRYRARPRP